MPNEPDDNRAKNYKLRRSIMDYGMGILIGGFGVFFALAHKLGFEFTIEPMFRYMFAGLCIVYGVWRFYRGYSKKYFTE